MAIRVYDRAIFDNNSDLLGFDWGAVIGRVGGQAASTGLNLLFGPHGSGGGGGGSQGGGCGSGRLTRDGDISNCLNQSISQIQAGTANLSPAEKLPVYQAFLAFISNDAYFDQSSNSNYLQTQKRVWPGYIADLQRQIAAEPAGTTQRVVDPGTGETVTVSAPAPSPTGSGFQIDSTLLIVGGGLVLLLLLKN